MIGNPDKSQVILLGTDKFEIGQRTPRSRSRQY